MSANQVEGNLPVDFAAGAAPSDLEIVWVDLSHKLFVIRTYLIGPGKKTSFLTAINCKG